MAVDGASYSCTCTVYLQQELVCSCQPLKADRPRRLLGIHDRSWPDWFAGCCRSAHCKARMCCSHPRQVSCSRAAARRPSCVRARHIGQKRSGLRTVSSKRFAPSPRKEFGRVIKHFDFVRIILHQTKFHLRTCLWVLLRAGQPGQRCVGGAWKNRKQNSLCCTGEESSRAAVRCSACTYAAAREK